MVVFCPTKRALDGRQAAVIIGQILVPAASNAKVGRTLRRRKKMNELDDLVDMAHSIFLRMAVRGGFDSYTGARLHEWLRRYENLPKRLSRATCPRCTEENLNIDGYCIACGYPFPPRKSE